LRFEDLAVRLHLNEELAEGLGSDSALFLKGGEAHGCVSLSESLKELIFG
jgi:hypothetical protein